MEFVRTTDRGSQFSLISQVAEGSEPPTADTVTSVFNAITYENKANLPTHLEQKELVRRINALEKLDLKKMYPKRTWDFLDYVTLGLARGCKGIYDHWRAHHILQEKQALLTKYVIQFFTYEAPVKPSIETQNVHGKPEEPPIPIATPAKPTCRNMFSSKEEASTHIEGLLSKMPSQMHKQVLVEILQWALQDKNLPLIQACRDKMGPLSESESEDNKRLWEQAIYYPWYTSWCNVNFAWHPPATFSTDKIREIILSGANLDTELIVIGSDYSQKGTPLQLAIANKHYDLAEELLLAGANPNFDEPNIWSDKIPLHWAVSMMKYEPAASKLFDILIQVGANPNLQDGDGRTALTRACESRNWEAFDQLLKEGADLNLKTKQGYTPLMLMFLGQNWEAFNRLIKAGADINIKDAKGKTLLMHADEARNPEAYPENRKVESVTYQQVYEILLNAGAKIDSQ